VDDRFKGAAMLSKEHIYDLVRSGHLEFLKPLINFMKLKVDLEEPDIEKVYSNILSLLKTVERIFLFNTFNELSKLDIDPQKKIDTLELNKRIHRINFIVRVQKENFLKAEIDELHQIFYASQELKEMQMKLRELISKESEEKHGIKIAESEKIRSEMLSRLASMQEMLANEIKKFKSEIAYLSGLLRVLEKHREAAVNHYSAMFIDNIKNTSFNGQNIFKNVSPEKQEEFGRGIFEIHHKYERNIEKILAQKQLALDQIKKYEDDIKLIRANGGRAIGQLAMVKQDKPAKVSGAQAIKEHKGDLDLPPPVTYLRDTNRATNQNENVRKMQKSMEDLKEQCTLLDAQVDQERENKKTEFIQMAQQCGISILTENNNAHMDRFIDIAATNEALNQGHIAVNAVDDSINAAKALEKAAEHKLDMANTANSNISEAINKKDEIQNRNVDFEDAFFYDDQPENPEVKTTDKLGA
jgi:hypothetical protein